MLYITRSIRKKIRELKIARFTPYFERWILHQILSALSFGARRHYLWLMRLRLQWVANDSQQELALRRLGALWATAASTLIELISDTRQLSDVVGQKFKVICTQKNDILKTEVTYSEIKKAKGQEHVNSVRSAMPAEVVLRANCKYGYKCSEVFISEDRSKLCSEYYSSAM